MKTRNFISKTTCCGIVSLTLLAFCLTDLASGQPIRGFRGDFGGGLRMESVEPLTQDSVDDSEGAGLKTDPDLETLLKKADVFRKDGNFRLATKYWQAVLEKSGDALYSEDNKIYFSLGQQVENIIAKLPKEGLSMYRITADASAQEILAASKNESRVKGLSRVVKEYFVSSYGDDAAFELGNYYLDRFDFIGAIRLHKKIVESYPDPSVKLDQVWLRLALAYAYVGNRKESDAAMAKAKELTDDEENPAFQQIVKAIESAEAFVKSTSAQKAWMSRLGGSQRSGVMQPFDLKLFDRDLKPIWSYAIAPSDSHSSESIQGKVALNPELEFLSSEDEDLAEKWRKHSWRPAGELLFANNKVFYRTDADVTVWDVSGKETDVVWRPLWLNMSQFDGATLIWQAMSTYNRQGKFNRSDYPKKYYENFNFGDEIAHSMSIHNGTLYVVEGDEYIDSKPTRKKEQYRHGTAPRRTRINNLTAYNLETGQFKWRFPPVEDDSQEEKKKPKVTDPAAESEEDVETGIMGHPVGYGKLLLVPVNASGSIWVYALDTEQEGKTVWKSFLCDEPSSGSNEWATILMTLDGSDLYVNCGYGAFFVLDPTTGSVRFARRYGRSGARNNYIRNRTGSGGLIDVHGFSHDIVIPYGNRLVLLASDHDKIVGFDRQNGKKVWEAPAHDVFGTKVDYLIGIHNGMLYAGGKDNVIAYDLNGDGRMMWTIEDHLQGELATGRAMLTTNGIFVPVGQKIKHFDLQTGRLIKEVGVRLPGRSPLGNLYSDGKKIWVHNGNRILALGPVEEDSEDKSEEDKESKEDKESDDDSDKKEQQ